MERILEAVLATCILVVLSGIMATLAQAEEYFVPDSYEVSALNCVVLALDVIEQSSMGARIDSFKPAPFGLVEIHIKRGGYVTPVYCGSDKSTGTSYIDSSIVDVMRYFGIKNPI